MKDNRYGHIIIAMAALVILAAGVFAGMQQRNNPCEKITIFYENNPTDTLLNEEEIFALAYSGYDSIIGTTIKDIDLEAIKDAVLASPYIKEVNLSYGLSGTLNIYIEQEEIIARIINTASQHYYLTESGYYIPTGGVTVRVPVFTGYISPVKNRENRFIKDMENPIYEEIYLFAKALTQHPFMHALSEQVHINRKKRFEVTPKLGFKNIVVGECENLEQRFNNLQLFYEQKLPFMERSTYNELNISFDNQIIAKK